MTQELVITAEQIAERDAWENRLISGQCALHEALMMILHIGAPASSNLVKLVELAFMSYGEGHCDDLGIPFGCALDQRIKKKNEHETYRSHVKFHVQSFIDQNYSVLNPGNYPDSESAFTKTAELLKTISASTAFDIHYDRDIKKRKRNR